MPIRFLPDTGPEKETECVLVLLPDGRIPDYLLYSMGLKDAAQLNRVITGVMDGETVDTSIEESTEYQPEDFLGIRFRVLPASRRFSYDEKLELWLDCANDEAAMKELLDQAEELEITGVAAPTGDRALGVLQFGIDYRPELMEKLIGEAAESEVVKAQLSNPDYDILTGREFGDEESMLSDEMTRFMEFVEVHPENLPDALSVDWEEVMEYLDDHKRLSAKDTVRSSAR